MAKVKGGNAAGKGKEKAERAAVRHHEAAPCSQGFNVNGKSGKKKRSWWSGFKPTTARPDAD